MRRGGGVQAVLAALTQSREEVRDALDALERVAPEAARDRAGKEPDPG